MLTDFKAMQSYYFLTEWNFQFLYLRRQTLLLNLTDYRDKTQANSSNIPVMLLPAPFLFLSSHICWKSPDRAPPLSQQTETKVKSGFPRELQVHVEKDYKKTCPHQALI